MKFYKISLFYGCLLGWITNVLCRDCIFNVISFNSNDVYVHIKGANYRMIKEDPDIPLYVLTIKDLENIRTLEYYYIADGIRENFDRKLLTYTRKTYNELFNRYYTVKNIPRLGFPTENIWTKNPDSIVFDNSYIPTVIVTNEEGENFFYSAEKTTLPRVDIILKDSVHTFRDVRVKPLNIKYNMFSFKMKLPDDGINGMITLFFSTTETDPTMMHQLIYSDLLQAIQNPVSKTVPCRVYDNQGQGRGVYILQEDSTSKDFIYRHFIQGENLTEQEISSNIGSIILGTPKADFYWGKDSDPTMEYSEFKTVSNYESRNDTLITLGALSEALHDLNIGDIDDVNKFNNEWFDLHIFFKALAIQYLTGNWNSYWMCLNNYILYSNPMERYNDNNDSNNDDLVTKMKHYFIENKVLFSFGSNIDTLINKHGDEFPSQSYRTLVNRNWSVYETDSNYRIAIIKLLDGGLTKGMFEKYLVNIVKYVFNPVNLNNKIDVLTLRLKEEVEWNSKLERAYIGENGVIYTVDDFIESIEGNGNTKYNRWGLKQWIKKRAEAVKKEFGVGWYHSVIDHVNAFYLEYVEVKPITHDDYMLELQSGEN